MIIDGKELGSIFLAPMAGVTEVGFRHVCKVAGADLTYTEMVNSKALNYGNEKTKDLILTTDIENPKAIQIFGNNADDMAQVCKNELLQKFDIIDINFGCPAPKIVKNGEGSALLLNLPKVKEIVTSCVKASEKPITCKFRTGFDSDHIVATDMAKLCEDCGAKMITVHGRTRAQMYEGGIDYDTIAKVKQSVKIPVVGNGNIFDVDSYKKMLSTGVDGVLVARGALGNPNLFRELKGLNPLNKYELIETHVKILREHFDEKFIIAHMRKHFLWYVNGIDNASKIRLQLATSENIDDSLKILKEILL